MRKISFQICAKYPEIKIKDAGRTIDVIESYTWSYNHMIIEFSGKPERIFARLSVVDAPFFV